MFAYLLALSMIAPGASAADRETFRWRGKVDGVDDIIIKGRDVRVEHIAAQPIQSQNHRFSAPLPSAEVSGVSSKGGRGGLPIRTLAGRSETGGEGVARWIRVCS